jgi:hypothetical protein
LRGVKKSAIPNSIGKKFTSNFNFSF